MQMSVYEVVANVLKENKVETVYGLPSDDLQLMNAIEGSGMEFLVNKDQRNAVFMTIGQALAKRKIGVCVVGKGPAVSNCVTGLLEAHSQSAPILIIGSGTRTQIYGNRKAFQEADQISFISPLVKWCHRLESPSSIEWVLKKAMFLALHGKPGPVYIEIPEDIGEAYVEVDSSEFSVHSLSAPMPNLESIKVVKDKLMKSKRPLLLLGGGCKSLVDNHKLNKFANIIGSSVFVTASGRGAYDEEDDLFCGLAGLYCSQQLLPIVQESDLVITLGSKLEETALFGWEDLLKQKEVVQINIHEEDFNLEFRGMKLVGDIGLTVDYLTSLIQNPLEKEKWLQKIAIFKQEALLEKKGYLQNIKDLSVAHVLEGLQLYTPSNAIYVHENGLQDMWSYYFPYLKLKKGQNAFVPSEQTSLGFGLSAAVGIAKAQADRPVVAFVGDGAFNLFRSELETVINNRVPVIYVVLKNGGYGWLQFQNKNKKRKNPLSFVNPMFPLVGVEHPQLKVLSLKKQEDVGTTFKEAYQQYNQGKTVIVECVIQLEDVPAAVREIYGDFPKKGVELVESGHSGKNEY